MFYNSTKNLPEKMPTNLKDLISVAVNNPHKVINCSNIIYKLFRNFFL